MYLIDLREEARAANSLSSLTRDVSVLCSDIYEEMEPEETMWMFTPAEQIEEKFWPVGMAAADAVREQSPFVLKNIISRYQDETRERQGKLSNSYEEILFMIKNKREYFFNKDAIRVEHVYEGNEWSDRKEGTSSYHDYNVRRYNPKGKDPGNVWLREIRTETPNKTVDRIDSLPRSEAILRCIRAGSQAGEHVTAIGFDEAIMTMLEEEGRDGMVVSINEFMNEGA